MSYGEIVPISIWKTSGWSAEYAVQNLQDKCLIEVKVDDEYWWSFEMHDHLRDLGRQMADELGPPRLWRPDTLRSMEAKGFKHILEETKSRCFNSIWDSSLGSTLIYFIGSLDDSAETQLLWLEINRGVGSLQVPKQISLRKMQCVDETTQAQLLRPWIPIRILCYSNDSDKTQLMWLESNRGAGGSLKEIPSWIPLQKLQYLALDDVEGLWNSFQQQMQSNSQELRRLHIFGSPLLQKLPELGQLERLNTLEVERCYELETVSGLSSLIGLQSLKLYRCTKLETISELSSLTGLQSLHVQKCYRVETIPEMSSLRGLQSLHVQECYRLETISGLSSLTGLQSLHVQECLRLKTISGISSIAGLQFLHVQECPIMETIFNLSSLTELGSIHMQGYAGNCFKYELLFSEEFNVADLRYLERIAILGCQLQSVQGFEELQGLKSLAIEVPENGYAWVRNCVYTLRMLPSECTVLIGNAVDEAMSRLNVQLFSEMIDGPTIHDIEREGDTVHMNSSWSAITIYALLCECGQIKVSAKLQNPYTYYFNSPRGGQVMFSIILPPQGQLQFTVDRREFGFRGKVVKGFKAILNGGEEGKALTVLQSLVDRLYR